MKEKVRKALKKKTFWKPNAAPKNKMKVAIDLSSDRLINNDNVNVWTKRVSLINCIRYLIISFNTTKLENSKWLCVEQEVME